MSGPGSGFERLPARVGAERTVCPSVLSRLRSKRATALAAPISLSPEGNMKERERKQKKIAFFGHFNSTNFGNESTLQAILYHLRCFYPNAEVTCICTGPEATVATHHIEAIPLAETFFKSWVPRTRLLRVL